MQGAVEWYPVCAKYVDSLRATDEVGLLAPLKDQETHENSAKSTTQYQDEEECKYENASLRATTAAEMNGRAPTKTRHSPDERQRGDSGMGAQATTQQVTSGEIAISDLRRHPLTHPLL